MSAMQFEGDLLLHETLDGGDVLIEDGLFISDRQFSTAAYLTLFGGNKEDAGKVSNGKEWWGNVLNGIAESEKLKSRFQHIITGFPMTVKNIKEAEAEALTDFQWFIDEKIADQIFVNIQTVGTNRFNLTVEILKDELILFENEYSLLWGTGNGESV